MRRTQEGIKIVISFSVKEARTQLLAKGIVYTFRWKRRKKTGNDWANSGRGTKKIVDVIIEEVAEIMPNYHPLKDYYKQSGFSHWWVWFNKIMELKPKNHGPDGWLYKVTKRYPENCTLCDTPFDEAKKSKDGKRMLFPYPPKHYLCWDCFTKSMDAGLGRLNKKLAEGNLDLSVEEIADTIKPESIESQQLRSKEMKK